MHCWFQLLAPNREEVSLWLRPLKEEETLKGYFLIVFFSCPIYLITCRAALLTIVLVVEGKGVVVTASRAGVKAQDPI